MAVELNLWAAGHLLPRVARRAHDVPAMAVDLGDWMRSGAARGQLDRAYDDSPDLPSSEWVDHEADHVMKADFYFMTSEMGALVQAHASDFPHDADPPNPVCEHGLLLLEAPVQLWPSAPDRLLGIYWHRGATTLLLGHDPHLDRVLTLTPKLRLDSSPDARAGWPDGTRAAWNVLATVHALLGQRIARLTETRVDRAARRRLQRRGHDQTRPVTIIELRRPVATTHDAGTSSSVNWSCRWIVGAHWRRQWYPSTGRHEAKLIAPHLKGPADRPLIVSERVFRWSR